MKSSTTRPTSDVLLADMMLLHPKLIDLSLGRVERLLAKLGHPEKKLPPVVHIAGTNGKGSVTAYLGLLPKRPESVRTSIHRRISSDFMSALRSPATTTGKHMPSTKISWLMF